MNIEQTLTERGARYGDFAEHARIAQGLKDIMWQKDGWSRLTPAMRQALEVIADKIARILNGDPTYADNWHDIQGYAQLVEKTLQPQPALVNLTAGGVRRMARDAIRVARSEGHSSRAMRRICAHDMVHAPEVKTYILDNFLEIDMELEAEESPAHVQD